MAENVDQVVDLARRTLIGQGTSQGTQSLSLKLRNDKLGLTMGLINFPLLITYFIFRKMFDLILLLMCQIANGLKTDLNFAVTV